jgi:hypothetical protein
MEFDIIGITETKFKLTIAAQKLILPESNTYPVKAVPKLIKNKRNQYTYYIFFKTYY